jgi:hypothetical protein
MRASRGKATVYAGEGSNVLKEAHERKRGGKVEHHGEGEKGKRRHDRKERARGGHVSHREGSAYEEAHESAAERKREAAEGRKRGGGMKHHAPGRKRGGGIGANLTPLSTAARIKEVTKGEQAEDSPKDD